MGLPVGGLVDDEGPGERAQVVDGRGAPQVGARAGRAELVLESGFRGDRALGQPGDAVHEGELPLILAAPVDPQGSAGDPVDHVHHDDVVLAYLENRRTSRNAIQALFTP